METADYRALMTACSDGDLAVVRKELKVGGLAQDLLAQTFEVAAAMGNIDVLKIFIDEHYLLPTTRLYSPLLLAFRNKKWDTVVYLLTETKVKDQIKIGGNEHEIFRVSCSQGNLEQTRWLLTSPDLKEHSNPLACGNHALTSSCLNGHYEVMEFLLQWAVDHHILDKMVNKESLMILAGESHRVTTWIEKMELNKTLDRSPSSMELTSKRRL